MNKYRPMPEMRPVRHAGSAEDLMMMMTMMEVDAKKIWSKLKNLPPTGIKKEF